MSEARKRLLVVDDDLQVIQVLCDHLQPRYTVESAPSGAAALATVRRQRPDVVLLDLHMPGVNGLEVLKQLRQIDPTIRVIMVTASEDTAEAAELLRHGAFSYIPKPFDLRYIDHLVATACS